MTFRSLLRMKVKWERRLIGLARLYHCVGRTGGCYCTSKVVTRPRGLDLVLHGAIVFATVDRSMFGSGSARPCQIFGILLSGSHRTLSASERLSAAP